MIQDPNSHPLSSLLSILNEKQPGFSIASVVNDTTIELMSNLLLREDFVTVAGLLSVATDAKHLTDFILHLLRCKCLPTGRARHALDLNHRARRFMLKVISKVPVIPASLVVTGIIVPAERNYIGSGGFGCVCKGEWEGKVVALKTLHKSENRVAFCREALMWGSLEHKFVLQFIGIHEIEHEMAPQYFLISPYMKNGTLAQWRKRRNPSTAEIEERILEVAQGLEYIHSEGAVHGDIRGENIVLDDNLHVQIADFGLTRLSEATNTQSGAKHANFSGPELFGIFEDADDPSAENPTRTQVSDVYAFGCLYYEIHFDSIPFSGKNEVQIMTLVTRGTRPSRIEEPFLSDVAWNVIQRCWVQEPSQRPRMEEVTERMLNMSESASSSPFDHEMQREASPTLSFTTTPATPTDADRDMAQSEYEKGQLTCQQCGTYVSFLDEDSGEFTSKHWEAHREVCSAPQQSSNEFVKRIRECAAEMISQPSAKRRRRAKRTTQERIEYFETDPYVAKFEAYRVLCASCDKWIQLRRNCKYSSIPWDLHRKNCLAKKVKSVNIPALEERNALFSKDSDVRRFDLERVLCNICTKWLSVSPDDHLQAVQKWLQHRAACRGNGTGPLPENED